MANYVVSYDLVDQRDYKKIHDAMAPLDSAKLLESLWLLSSSSTSAQIRDWMKTLTDNDDKIAVIELGRDWGTYNALTAGVEWLKNHL